MLTELGRDELIAYGAGYPGALLVTQAGYTTGIATEAGAPLGELLPAGYLEELVKARQEVEAAAGDKANVAAESKDATHTQNTWLRDAKVLRRKIASRGRRARRLGRKVPDVLTVISRAATVAPVLDQLTKMTAALKDHLPAMGAGAQALLDEATRIHGGLGTADADQEHKRLAKLPEKVRDFYAAKGALYIGLKVVNDAGQELFAHDPAAAGRFNLKILYRRGIAPAGGPTPAPPV
ncbi:MAG: hypothetical protein HY906_05395 [Deltaproteobacteria bacterium]|nr:hypothetical protein [Deltaproteobacteria bacterium]